MGLTIYYNGRFSKQAVLADMIEEVRDIAKVFKWKYTIQETVFPEGSLDKDEYDGKVYGITVTPPSSETLSLNFLSNGRMSSSIHLNLYGHLDDKSSSDFLYMLFTKTQYAGKETHKLIINMLRYISQKYFSVFNVEDDSLYWETNDEQKLSEAFRSYDVLMDTAYDGLTYVPMKEGETLEEYFTRILK